jgi:hypothetical protein
LLFAVSSSSVLGVSGVFPSASAIKTARDQSEMSHGIAVSPFRRLAVSFLIAPAFVHALASLELIAGTESGFDPADR